MESGETTGTKCPRCGETVARGQECSKCGSTAPDADIRPLGGWVESTPKQSAGMPGAPRPAGEVERPRTGPPSDPSPGPVPPPSSIRDPRATLERRRRERAEEAARYSKLSYSEYLGLVLRQDHVFAALLGLMGLMIALELVAGGRTMWVLAILQAVGLLGILTFQRWAHTAVVWLMGVGLLNSGLSLFGLLFQPLYEDSTLALVGSWVSWFVTTATCVFVLVVLMERRAYFEGVQARVPPKQRRLKDVLASAKDDLRRAEPYEVRTPVEDAGPRTTAAERRAEPSAYDPRGETASPREVSHDRYRAEPAPGRVGGDRDGVREALSWGYIRDLASQDRVFGLLLALLVLQAVVVVVQGTPLAAVGAIVVIWGIITLHIWAFWTAVATSAMLSLWHLRLLSVAGEIGGTGGMVFFGAIAGLNLLIVGLLLARREHFS